jgi:hypothetical protein
MNAPVGPFAGIGSLGAGPEGATRRPGALSERPIVTHSALIDWLFTRTPP